MKNITRWADFLDQVYFDGWKDGRGTLDYSTMPKSKTAPKNRRESDCNKAYERGYKDRVDANMAVAALAAQTCNCGEAANPLHALLDCRRAA